MLLSATVKNGSWGRSMYTSTKAAAYIICDIYIVSGRLIWSICESTSVSIRHTSVGSAAEVLKSINIIDKAPQSTLVAAVVSSLELLVARQQPAS